MDLIEIEKLEKELENLYNQLVIETKITQIINFVTEVIVPIMILIVTIIIVLKISKIKKQREEEIEYFKKAINEIQNITSRQQEMISIIRDTNNEIFKNTSVLKQIQKQTLPDNAEEQRELKKKLEELNKLVK